MSTWKIDPPPPGHRNPWCVRDEANDVVAIIPITTLRPAEQIAREIVAEHNAAQAGDGGTVARLREAVKVLRWELHQQHNLEAKHWVTEREVRMEDCPRCHKLTSFDEVSAALAHEPAATGEPTA